MMHLAITIMMHCSILALANGDLIGGFAPQTPNALQRPPYLSAPSDRKLTAQVRDPTTPYFNCEEVCCPFRTSHRIT